MQFYAAKFVIIVTTAIENQHRFYLFLKIFFYLFLETGEGREKERRKNIDMRNINQLPLMCVLTGD